MEWTPSWFWTVQIQFFMIMNSHTKPFNIRATFDQSNSKRVRYSSLHSNSNVKKNSFWKHFIGNAKPYLPLSSKVSLKSWMHLRVLEKRQGKPFPPFSSTLVKYLKNNNNPGGEGAESVELGRFWERFSLKQPLILSNLCNLKLIFDEQDLMLA